MSPLTASPADPFDEGLDAGFAADDEFATPAAAVGGWTSMDEPAIPLASADLEPFADFPPARPAQAERAAAATMLERLNA